MTAAEELLRDVGGDSNPPALAGEEWRPVGGFPHYAVSSLGRVWSTNCDPPRLLRPSRNEAGYLFVVLNDASRPHTKYVSRLVCEAWHGAPGDDALHAAHLDGNIYINTPDNLAWATPSENNMHKHPHGTITTKLSVADVLNIVAGLKGGNGIKPTARQYGVAPRTIEDIRDGKNWSWLTGIQKKGGNQ